MSQINEKLARNWMKIDARFLPFSDLATAELSFGRLLRMSLFQLTVGMALALLIGTLNRVMIVELGVSTGLVAVMAALPLLFAPFRAFVGFRSDNHRSVLGWRRVPYLWMGTLLQFGGFAIMPFALIILSGDTNGPAFVGHIGAALAFLLVGAGMHMVQTVSLALATDVTPVESHPKVVALLCIMLLAGMVAGALVFGYLLADFSQIRLIRVIQGAAVTTMVVNIFALWKQEGRDPSRTSPAQEMPSFGEALHTFKQHPRAIRRLVAVGLGTVGFSLQDILLEPYGGEILKLTVGQTTAFTAVLALGGLIGFATAARWLGNGADPYRVAATGTIVGLAAFCAVIFSAPLSSILLFGIGVGLIGLGGGLFGHATLTAALGMARKDQVGLALGVWGTVQATAAGGAIALGGLLKDGVSILASQGVLGPALNGPATGYILVYHIELALLFCTLVAIGPLVRIGWAAPSPQTAGSGFAEISR